MRYFAWKHNRLIIIKIVKKDKKYLAPPDSLPLCWAGYGALVTTAVASKGWQVGGRALGPRPW